MKQQNTLTDDELRNLPEIEIMNSFNESIFGSIDRRIEDMKADKARRDAEKKNRKRAGSTSTFNAIVDKLSPTKKIRTQDTTKQTRAARSRPEIAA